MIEASKELLYARRRIEEINNVEIIDDLKWDDQSETWYIKICVYDIETINANVPKNTVWYVVMKNDYPQSEIKVFPAVDGGIVCTFNHQNNNGIISDNKLWRKGNLCLSNTYDGLLRVETEPSNFQDKLFWNVMRTVEWVKAAAANRLVCEKDFYEKPDFNTRIATIVAYNEDLVSMMEWEENDVHYGCVDLVKVNSNQYFAESFVSISGSVCKGTKWGRYLNDCENYKIKAAWILLKSEPVINGWQAPNTYAELSDALKNQNVNFEEILKSVMKNFRDGKRHAVMVGFPIPEKIGMSPDRIHWETFMLPVLSCGDKTADGFRNNEVGWQRRDFQEIILGNKKLDWVVCENWNSNEILNRGRFSKIVSKKRILLIGAGTLGACIGEQLVRGGAYKLTVMDSDKYMIGNTARHTLGISSIGKPKAEELAKHYNSVNPNAAVNYLNEDFTRENVSIIDKYDIILDCTASNEVLKILECYKPRKEKVYISVSFGYKAETLFLSYSKCIGFDMKAYMVEFGKYLEESQDECIRNDLPWDGVGCWHPVFPAMACDVQMVASFAMGVINGLLEKDTNESKYYTFKKKYDQDGVIQGFARI